MSGEHIDERDLTLYHYAELEAPATLRLEAHLATCQGCRARLDRLRQTLAAVARPQVEISAVSMQRFTAGVMRRTQRRRWSLAAVSGVSAAVAVALVAVVFWLPSRPVQNGTTSLVAEIELVEKMDLLQNLELLQSLPELEG